MKSAREVHLLLCLSLPSPASKCRLPLFGLAAPLEANINEKDKSISVFTSLSGAYYCCICCTDTIHNDI